MHCKKYGDRDADADDEMLFIFINMLNVVLQNIFKFWLDKGVDALSINDIHAFYESDDTALDEPATDDETLPVSVWILCAVLYLITLTYIKISHLCHLVLVALVMLLCLGAVVFTICK